jgi:hypothetical protein
LRPTLLEIPHLHLEEITPDPQVIGLLPAEVAHRYQALPIILKTFVERVVAVGTPVAWRPPHRSVLAELLHTAPASSINVKPL